MPGAACKQCARPLCPRTAFTVHACSALLPLDDAPGYAAAACRAPPLTWAALPAWVPAWWAALTRLLLTPRSRPRGRLPAPPSSCTALPRALLRRRQRPPLRAPAPAQVRARWGLPACLHARLWITGIPLQGGALGRAEALLLGMMVAPMQTGDGTSATNFRLFTLATTISPAHPCPPACRARERQGWRPGAGRGADCHCPEGPRAGRRRRHPRHHSSGSCWVWFDFGRVGFGWRGSSKPGQGWMAGCPQYLQPRRPSHTVSPHPRARCCSVCWRQLSRPSAPGTRSPRQPPREPSRVRTGIVSPFGTQPTPRDQQQAVLSQRWAASPTQRSGELALTPLCPALAPCPCRRGGSDRIRRRPGGWSGGEGA